MKKTFVCNESMIITIPIGSLKDAQEGQLMPETFHCVYKDAFKVFVVRGKPKPLGAAQAIAGVFILALSLISKDATLSFFIGLPSILFILTGMLSYAAGHFPNMHVTKLAFSLNIISLFWSIVALSVCGFWLSFNSYQWEYQPHLQGISGLITSLVVLEMFIAVFLIYWLSKAVCRQHYNILPIILLKQGE